jgi:hypothetical protein
MRQIVMTHYPMPRRRVLAAVPLPSDVPAVVASLATPVLAIGGLEERPALPVLSPAVRRATGAVTVGIFGEDGYRGTRERFDIEPAAVRPEDVADLRRHLAELDEALMPAEPGWLLARILGLLSHYRDRELPEAVEQALANDWAKDLAEYPAWAIAEAVRVWRRANKWAPKISEIREICDAAVGEHRRIQSRLQAVLLQLEGHSPALPKATVHAFVQEAAEGCRMPGSAARRRA